jgi:hypothetical protein
MLLKSSFALAKVLFCYIPNKNLFISRKLLLSSQFRFVLAKMSFCFIRDKSLFMSSKSLLLLLFREFCVTI